LSLLNKYIVVGSIFFLLAGGISGQDSTAAPPDSMYTALGSNLLRSAIIPGWGQIGQERPLYAMLYYGAGVSCIYGMLYNHNQYNKYGNEKYQNRFYTFAGLYGSLLVLNMADIIFVHYKFKPEKWQGAMFSDKPIKSPWGAVVRSAMLPGWGQCYNESYIKAVISFSICFIFARKVYIHHQRYRKNHGPVERDHRSENAWYLGITYFANMLDAFVDAYLYRFDQMMEMTVITTPIEEGIIVGIQFSL
jgi:hypothetical protein